MYKLDIYKNYKTMCKLDIYINYQKKQFILAKKMKHVKKISFNNCYLNLGTQIVHI